MGKSIECAICGDEILVESKVVPQHILVMECCNMTPLHRECIQVWTSYTILYKVPQV